MSPQNEDRHARSRLLFGEEGLARIQSAEILLLGLGGVGGAAFEALVRAGVGQIHLVDGDCFTENNLNRQILASEASLGRPKVELAVERARAIGGETQLSSYEMKVTAENAGDFLKSLKMRPDALVIDCIDDIPAKVSLLQELIPTEHRLICSGGAGNRLLASGIRYAYLEDAFSDPLLKTLRRRLGSYPKKRIYTAFSPHAPLKIEGGTIASSPYLPNVMGFSLAGLAIGLITRQKGLL